MPAPRVIFVNRVYWPSQAATAQLLADLAEELAVRGWDVHVVAAGLEPEIRHGVTIHRTGPGDAHGGLASRARNYAAFLQGARRVLRTLVEPGDVVVSMTDPPMLAVAVTRLVQDRGARVVHWIQDIYPEIVSAHTGRWAAMPLAPLQWLRNRAWRDATFCVPVSADMAATVERQVSNPNHVRVVHNWAPRELQLSPDPAAVARLRASWGFADKFVVAYSGNLGRVHEFSTVLDAAALLIGEPEIVFVFVGQGARMSEVATAAAARQLCNVHFRPPTPRGDLAIALAAADAHLVTLKAGFEHLVSPSKLAGILAAGRPALYVGPLETEIARLLAAGPCGRAIDPGDALGLAAALRDWRNEPALRSTIGRHARQCYDRQFTLSKAADSWAALLRAVPAGKPMETSVATTIGR